jgi:hypothetical protein
MVGGGGQMGLTGLLALDLRAGWRPDESGRSPEGTPFRQGIAASKLSGSIPFYQRIYRAGHPQFTA